MEKILSSEMAVEEINKRVERKNEIVDEVEAKKEEFESADTDKRDEILEEVEELTKEADQIDEDVKELTEEKEKFEEQEERMSMINVLSAEKVEARKATINTVIDERDTPEYRKAWRHSIMKGDDKEARALLTELAEDGQVPVPTYVQSRVEAAWERLSILNEVSISNYKGILAVPYEISADPANFHVEGAAAPEEEQLTIGKILLSPIMLKKWIRVSDEVMALTDEAFMDYVVDEIIYQINLLLENSVISRNAQDGVVGITNAALTEEVSTALSFNAINAGIAELMEVGDPVVIMNRKTFYSNVMGLTDLQERPIFQIATDNMGRARHYINGARVLFTNGLKAYDEAAANEAWAIVGDLKAYKLNLPESRIPLVLFDPYTQAEYDMNKFVGRLLAAGNVVRPKALAKLVKPE